MKEFKYSRIDDKLYYEELANGLKVCIIPNANKDSFYAVLGVKYGSFDTSFVIDNQEVTTNYGIAHFLEHMNFYMENAEDPFSYFNKSGVNSNASTSYKTTKFYIWGTEKFKENFNYLLDFVLSPYFPQMQVDRERDVINEEIRMYADDPIWQIDEIAKKAVFQEYPIRENIAGTYESIAKITEEELYKCYNNFYVPNNMCLAIGGNVNVDDVMSIIKNNKKVKGLKKQEIKRLSYDEKDEVLDEYKEVRMNIVVPKAKYLFKMNENIFNIKSQLRLEMYLNMVLSIIFGSTSEFSEKVIDEKIVTSYYADWSKYGNYYVLEFAAETDKADIFKDLVDVYLKNINISESDFRRIKRVWIASEIKMSDSGDMPAENAIDDFINYGEIYTNRIDIIESLKLSELEKIIDSLNFDNCSFILANPLDDK